MIELGVINALEVLRETSVGLFLGDGEGHEVLLPWKYVPGKCAPGSMLEVFIYHDGEERLIATTLEPLISLHQFALLKVAAISPFGAFMDWGLENDLLVPWKEQAQPMQEGQHCIVFMYIDERTGRLVGSTRIHQFLSNPGSDIREGDKVQALVWEKTDLGMNVIINHRYKGLIYYNEIFRDLNVGDKLQAWVSRIREDNRLDILLQEPGYRNIETEAARLCALLKEAGGFLPFTDKSNPDEIVKGLGMSKKTFKKAAGLLYKSKVISISDEGITLTV